MVSAAEAGASDIPSVAVPAASTRSPCTLARLGDGPSAPTLPCAVHARGPIVHIRPRCTCNGGVSSIGEMPAAVGWMDISPAALRKLHHALEDQPDGVVDELGLLALHTGYGHRFLPGTSVLQTRARYLFFVPWVYLDLARGAAVNVRERKQRAELRITEQLKKSVPHESEGIIGTRTFPSPPAQPAEFAYWTALCAYGFHEGVPRSALLARWGRRRIHHRAKIRVREEAPTSPRKADICGELGNALLNSMQTSNLSDWSTHPE
ncbi:MAG TPA: DUF6361 family protein [Sorangium sp.]|nr:DUF6361 family protein [Sorangium sp.]